MIRAVHLRMTVLTTACQQEPGIGVAIPIVTRVGLAGMTGG